MKNNWTKLNMMLLVGAMAATSCNNSGNGTSNSTDSVNAKIDTVAQNIKDKTNAAVSTVASEFSGNADSNFVVKATVANMEELAVLQAGVDNGTSPELKKHAKMMIADHKKLGAGVGAYAKSKNYTVPADDNGKSADDLAKLNKHTKGADWDKAWVDFMVDAHSNDISMFEKYQDKVKDPALKQMITDALPVLHSHYDMMKGLQSNMAPNK